MFTRKYIFETKNTRDYRYFKNFLLLLSLSLILYLLFGLILIKVAKNENNKSEHSFFKRKPDLIVVFTGDRGRIPYAIKLAKSYKQSNILITGVYSKNTVESIIVKNRLQNLIDTDMLDIDYLARNTVENVIYTLRHLRKNPEIKSILVVSHNYHIMRIRNVFESLTSSKEEKYKIHYSGLQTDFTSFRNFKILYKEVFKLFRSYIFLLFWEQEITPNA